MRLEASELSAPALDDAFAHRHVSDVPGAALGASMQGPPGHEAGADTGADLDEDDVPVSGSKPAAELTEGHHVHVVVDPHRCMET